MEISLSVRITAFKWNIIRACSTEIKPVTLDLSAHAIHEQNRAFTIVKRSILYYSNLNYGDVEKI